MRFSIIIPVLNEAQGIRRVLSALQHLRPDCEIIVVDGGSTDNTVTIAGALADTVLRSAKGRARQMNLGSNKANGEILIFLHADTLLPDKALQEIDKAVVDKHWGRFDIQLQGRHFMLKVIAFMMNWRSRATAIATGDQVIFVTKEAFIKVGGFPEIALMEDIALSQKLKALGSPACLKPKVISSGRRWEQFGVVRTILLMWSLRWRYFFGEKPEILADLYSGGKFWKT